MRKSKSTTSTSENNTFDFENLNIILNYDVPNDSQAFLQQLAGAFKLGAKVFKLANFSFLSNIL